MFRRFLILSCFAIGCGKSDPVSQPRKVVVQNNPQVKEASELREQPIVGETEIGTLKVPPRLVEKGFRFPDDPSGKLLAKILPPSGPSKLDLPSVRSPKERTLPDYLTNPMPFTNPIRNQNPHILIPKVADIQPRPLMDRVPIEINGLMPDLPRRIELPIMPLTKMESIQIDEVTPLSILARPSPDRASLEDPTMDYTSKSVIRPVIPIREGIAGFLKMNLANPFEFTETIELRQPLPNTPNAILGSIPPPKPPELK